MSNAHSPGHEQMGSASVLPLVIRMSIPAILSMLVQALYNIVDSIYVAQISEAALTAVSLAYPLQQMITAVSVGTGVGLNSVISRRLGEQRQREADIAAGHGLVLGLVSGAVFALIGLFGTPAFFSIFTTDSEVLLMGCQYGYVVMTFSFSLFLQINCEKILQATGDMKWPMIFQLAGAVTNIILDPILIFGWFGFPAMGVLGAAIATVTAQILSMVLSLFVVLRKKHAVHITKACFYPDKKVLADIYKVGFPAIIMQSLYPLLNMGLNAILSAMSQSAVAVMGIYNKLQSFVFMPLFRLNQGLMPITGYNFGAGNHQRLRKTLKVGLVLGISIMAAGMVIFAAVPGLLLDLFNVSPAARAIGIPALRIISSSFMFAAVSIVLSNFLQATGNGVRSMIISMIRQLLVTLPVAWLLGCLLNMGELGVWLSFPISEIISAAAAVGITYPVVRSIFKKKDLQL